MGAFINSMEYQHSSDIVRDYFTYIYDIPVLTSEEEKALFLKYQKTQDKDVLHKIVEHNLRLVPGIAKLYTEKCNHMKFEDLIQEGNYGLTKAVQAYDLNRGTKFSTFATSYILGTIKSAISWQEGTIRNERHFSNQLYHFKLIRQKCVLEGKALPSKEELCEELHIDMETLELIFEVYSRKVSSLDVRLKEDEPECLLDLIPDKKDPFLSSLNHLANREFMILCKFILRPISYFALYYRYFSSETISIKNLGKLTGTERQNISSLLKSTIRQLKPYLISPSTFSKKLQHIKAIEGRNLDFLCLNPIAPQDITKYLYAFPMLTEEERKVFYWELFGIYERKCPITFDILGMGKKDYYIILHSLQQKLKDIFQNYSVYEAYEEACLQTYKSKVYNLDLHYEMVNHKLIRHND